MTNEDLAAIVEGIAPVIVDLVTQSQVEMQQQQVATAAQIAQLVEATKEIGTMRERLAVLETRALVPGPPGPAGRDGVDGVGFDDLGVTRRERG